MCSNIGTNDGSRQIFMVALRIFVTLFLQLINKKGDIKELEENINLFNTNRFVNGLSYSAPKSKIKSPPCHWY